MLLFLDIFSNISLCTGFINMFELAVRDLQCIMPSFPSLCLVSIFKVPCFIPNALLGIWFWN